MQIQTDIAAHDPNHVVTDWYARKTDALLEKYGPGPRVHYHTGLVDPGVAPARDRAALREQIHRSQELLLDHAAQVWDAREHLSGDILDVGCGLGGGALYWAAEHRARVTALSPVARHLELVTQFAADAGLSTQVRTELGYAESVEGTARFDAAVTCDASNHFDRPRWFECMARVLRPGGHVFIADTFLVRAELAQPFNAYWVSNVGRRAEYFRAAHDAGFDLVGLEDVSSRAAGFWRLSAAYAEGSARDAGERAHAVEWQSRMYDACLDGGFEVLLMHFERRGA